MLAVIHTFQKAPNVDSTDSLTVVCVSCHSISAAGWLQGPVITQPQSANQKQDDMYDNNTGTTRNVAPDKKIHRRD